MLAISFGAGSVKNLHINHNHNPANRYISCLTNKIMIIILPITNTTLKITIINLQMNGYFIFKWKESLQFNLPNIFTKLFIPRLTYFILQNLSK